MDYTLLCLVVSVGCLMGVSTYFAYEIIDLKERIKKLETPMRPQTATDMIKEIIKEPITYGGIKRSSDHWGYPDPVNTTPQDWIDTRPSDSSSKFL